MPPVRSLNVQGRQKACSECMKAKRKCDLRQPRCARCSRQDLRCSYPRQHDPLTVPPKPGELHRQPSSTNAVLMEPPDHGLTISLLDLEAFNTSAVFEDQFLDLEMPTVVTSLDPLGHLPGSFTNDYSQVALHRYHSSAKSLVFSSAGIAPLTKSRIGYAIDQLKLAPRTMIENNSTLWCHAALYEEHMPRLLQDAYAACALYNARNETNADFLVRHIASRVDELIATPVPTDPMEILGRSHALMLYQIISVFGGNVQLYSQAEALAPRLEAVGHLLLDLSAKQNNTVGPLPLYPSPAARAAWTSFVFRETLRRTVLSLFQFATLCRLLRGQPSPCAYDLSLGNKVTLSASLWSAKNALDFAVAWNEKQHFLVYELDFTEVLRDAQPSDIDDFAKTILVGLQGIDDIKGWFYARGGTF